MKSVLRRMLYLPILLLIPLNILVICASMMNLHTSEREMEKEKQNTLNIIAVQIDQDIESADYMIQNYFSDSDTMIRQSGYSESDRGTNAYYIDMIDSLEYLNSTREMLSNMDFVFLKLPVEDAFWIRGDSTEAERQSLIVYADGSHVENAREITIPESDPQKIRVYFTNNNVIMGYQMSLTSYFAQLNENEEEWYLSDDESETFESNTGASEKVISASVGTNGLMIYSVVDTRALYRQISRLVFVLIVLSVIACVAAPIIVTYLYHQIYRPTNALKNGMVRIAGGDIDYRVPILKNPEKYNEFDELAQYLNDMVDQIQKMKLDVYELELKHQQMKLDYYSRQIRPHFILNALNYIYTYDSTEWNYAREMILDLTKYFRYVVNVKRNFVELGSEMQFVENYLHIQKQRLGQYFNYMVSWEHALKHVSIPPLLMSTFVENSIKYALSQDSRRYLAILVRRVQNGMVEIRISDSGKGYPEEILRQINLAAKGESTDLSGIGIMNAIQRLKMSYGDQASIRFCNENGAVTEIHIPFCEEQGENE